MMRPKPVSGAVRSQGGPEAGASLRAPPVCEYTQFDDVHFNIFRRRRARLPLPGGVRQCLAFRSCHSFLDRFGDHLAACPSTGLLKRRGTAFERVYRPIWKEAGVCETPQPFVKDLISDADPADLRQSDFEIRGCAFGTWHSNRVCHVHGKRITRGRYATPRRL